jgi:hypothetical protein
VSRGVVMARWGPGARGPGTYCCRGRGRGRDSGVRPAPGHPLPQPQGRGGHGERRAASRRLGPGRQRYRVVRPPEGAVGWNAAAAVNRVESAAEAVRRESRQSAGNPGSPPGMASGR